MSRPLIVGLMTEGTTDSRFLSSIIIRTVEELVFEGDQLPEIYDIQLINVKEQTFNESVVKAAIYAEESGVMILCIHVDADAKSDEDVMENKIDPAFEKVAVYDGAICQTIVPIIPVQMTEAWMLVDLSLLKEEIMTNKSNETLKLTRRPETIADPKEAITTALRIVLEDLPQKRRRYALSIADLYQPIGQKIDLEQLAQLPSYKKFRDNLKAALQGLNFLH